MATPYGGWPTAHMGGTISSTWLGENNELWSAMSHQRSPLTAYGQNDVKVLGRWRLSIDRGVFRVAMARYIPCARIINRCTFVVQFSSENIATEIITSTYSTSKLSNFYADLFSFWYRMLCRNTESKYHMSISSL